MLVRQVAETQAAEGHRTVVVSFAKSPGPLFDTFSNARNFWVESAAISWRSRREASSAFGKYLKDFSPDVVHSHSAWTDAILATFDQGDFAQVTHFHLRYGFYARQVPRSLAEIRHEAGRQLLISRQIRRNTQYIACSAHCADYYRKNLPRRARGRLHALENFCRIPIRAEPRPGLVAGHRIRLLVVSRLEPVKNVGFALEILESMVREHGVDAHLSIAGAGSLEPGLRATVASKDLGKHVTFLGVTDDIIGAYDAADFLVHCALEEQFGLVLVEAMARGLPCLASASLPSATHVFGRPIAGRMVPMDNPGSFAREILGLVRDPAVYRRLSALSIARASDFDFEGYMARLSEVYGTALNGRHRS